MGYLFQWAEKVPDKPAIVMSGSGSVRTYGDIERGSNQLAHLLRAEGLQRGNHYAVFAENHPDYMEACIGGERAGLYFTPINSHLTADEVAYLLEDSGSRLLITTPAMFAVAEPAVRKVPGVTRVLVLDPDDGSTLPELPAGWERYRDALASHPATPIADQSLGYFMVYSSGTTGRPKGVKKPMPDVVLGEDTVHEAMFRTFYAAGDHDVFLSAAPMYHTAPLGFCLVLLRMGATLIVMESFDASRALQLIEEHGVTFAQFVPTMFVRMLKLPEDERLARDMSSIRVAVHAAEPCPVSVKQRMIEWWGPIICEYYGGSESNGLTFITSEEWLAHKGSVGKPILGVARILDDDGRELGPREIGSVCFSDGEDFAYHNDAGKTAEAELAPGATTIGDVGYLDEDGYLYLTDRKAYMIISGGVNIYPQEAEHVLIDHPKVADVAVLGVPDPDMGEAVKAVVQPAAGVVPGPELEQELIAYCRVHLARYKCPRTIDFMDELPRLDTGKLYKRLLRDRYWATSA
jgi:acyl-CoA synthetase (AMP-forming)/AMP-acid ligase II